jgi:hypothetical protein
MATRPAVVGADVVDCDAELFRQIIGNVDVVALKVAFLIFEPGRRGAGGDRYAHRPTAQYLGENAVGGIRSATASQQLRYGQHQRQNATFKPPHGSAPCSASRCSGTLHAVQPAQQEARQQET